MEIKEAINELLPNLSFIIEEIEEHEEYADEETGEYQIQAYENNKKELEAFMTLFSAVDPTLKTIDDIKKRIEEVEGTEVEEEHTEEEKELAGILKSWREKQDTPKEYACDFELTVEENKELAILNVKTAKGSRRLVTEPDDEIMPSETDDFAFYQYRGEVCVILNGYADGSFNSYAPEWQKKALEIIKKKVEC